MLTPSKRVITSVKIPDKLYEDFKIMNVRSRINLQDLVERTMFLYLTESGFRETIHQRYNVHYTGSELLNSIK
jgi:hypothetical protein